MEEKLRFVVVVVILIVMVLWCEHQYSVVWFVQKVLPLDIQPSLAHEGREFSVHSTWSQLPAFDEVLFSITV